MDNLTSQEEKAVTEFCVRVRRQLGDLTPKFFLFGSRARGEGDENSDIDILVLLKDAPSKTRGYVFEIAADILVEYEIDISPLVMSEDHFRSMKERERLLPQEIERDGIPL